MIIIKKHIRNLILPLALVMAAGCSHDDDMTSNGSDQKDGQFVVLNIALPIRDTRSNPMGGEEGNGRENGVLNEDNIHDINVYFYEGANGLDSDAETPIKLHIYYNIKDQDDPNNSAIKDLTAEVKEDEENINISGKYVQLSFPIPDDESDSSLKNLLKEGLCFAAVANLGYTREAIDKLVKLRNLDFSNYSDHKWNAYKVSGTKANDMDYFLMSTGYNKDYRYAGGTTGSNKLVKKYKGFTGTTTLERLYARIDLWYNASDNAGIPDNPEGDTEINKLTYPVVSADENVTANRVYILNVLPVNVMQQPSYLFKKVTAVAPADAIGGWTQSFLANIEQFNWAGKETPDNIAATSPNADMPTNYVMERHTFAKSSAGNTGDLIPWYGSTATAQIVKDLTDRSKGAISGYYNYKREKVAGDPDYKSDRVSIISYANENTHPVDCYHSNYLTGLAMGALYIPAEIYKSYDVNVNGVKSPVAMTAEERNNFVVGSQKIYRYSPSKDSKVVESATLYFSNEEAMKAYAKDHPEDNAVITSFDSEFYTDKDGNKELGIKCYYNLWLRHYNNESADPQQSYPMEYAIVRNNIYRVALSFSGPGDPTPTMREPDTMQARIFVRKWNLREEGDPLEF